MIDVDVMQDASEIVHYDETEIPIYIRLGALSYYPDMKALCHWHEDMELIYITKGEMFYDINGKRVLLKENDSIVVNSRQMHYGFSHLQRDCEFICILFHPNLLSGNKKLYDRYVIPVIENANIEYLHYHAGTPGQKAVGDIINHLAHLKKEQPVAYELEVIGHISFLWKIIFEQCQEILQKNTTSENSDVVLQKKMVSYIYQHYTDAITLDEIAASGNMSRSKCCIIFKRYLQQSPIDFVNSYRLEVSCNLLASTAATVSQIATSCGFNHLSYFSELFIRKYGCTPTEYRKRKQF